MTNLPRKPTRELLANMALRFDHSFGLMSEAHRESLMRTMAQLYEEVAWTVQATSDQAASTPANVSSRPSDQAEGGAGSDAAPDVAALPAALEDMARHWHQLDGAACTPIRNRMLEAATALAAIIEEQKDWARRFKLNDVTPWEWMTRATKAETALEHMTKDRDEKWQWAIQAEREKDKGG